jgi:PAS domain S-box-containing protein
MKRDVVRRAWEQYIAGEEVPAKVRPPIAASWRRCRSRGLSPHQRPVLKRLQGQELQEHCHRAQPITRIGQPFMEKISRYVVPNSLVFLADAGGYIVMAEGDPNALFAQAPLFRVGTHWGEESQGTNAIGLVMREQESFQVMGAEHYLQVHHSLACSAAPIFSPEGDFLAVLGVATPLPAAHPHTLGMVVAAAAAVENQLGLERASDQLYSVVQSISDGLIAIDNNGLISQMNTVAGNIFGLSPPDCIGKPVEEVFRDSFSLLRVIKTGREGFNDRELAVDINGRRVRITVTSRPICSQQGKTFGVVLTCREMKSVQRLVNRMVGAQARFTFADLIGQDPGFTEIITMARRVARTDSTVFLVGESGTGKEMFAQAIHNASPRRNGPFVAMNCAALPRDLVESELFGYEEGAFTGAKRGGRPGKFELANGGTLFLDEIGDIPLETQVSLLRVLQERQVIRIGGHTAIPVQIRIIAATNKDIARLVEEGHFRLDLYYRLNVINLAIPPLRERGEDVLLLARHFLRRFAGQLGRREIVMVPAVERLLLRYPWPGNVRELQNVIEQAVHLLEDDILLPEHLPAGFVAASAAGGEVSLPAKTNSLADIEQAAVVEALRSCRGNISRAARWLGVGRTTLYRKIRLYRIDLEELRRSAP